jgi:hypothetical protein
MFLIPALVIKWIGALIKPINEFVEIVAPEIDEDTLTTFFETPIRATPVMDYSRISFSRVGGFIEQDDGPLDDKLFDNVGGGRTSNAAARGSVGGAPAGGGGLGGPSTGTGAGTGGLPAAPTTGAGAGTRPSVPTTGAGAGNSNALQVFNGWNNPSNRLGWSDRRRITPPQNAFDHWQSHRSEFPEFNNALEYALSAQRYSAGNYPGFLSRSGSMIRPPSNTPDSFYYNPTSNIMVMRNSRGVTTMHRLDPNHYQSQGFFTAIDWFLSLE